MIAFEESMARLLVTVESMRVPGTNNYNFPAFDTGLVVTNNISMTVIFTRDEVYPTIVTEPIKLGSQKKRDGTFDFNPVTIQGAFTPSVILRARGLLQTDGSNVIPPGLILPKFSPKNKDACVIFEIGIPKTTLRYLHFDQSSCTAVEEYQRTPIVYSSTNVGLSYVSDIMIQDGPGPLFKGKHTFGE